jgi:hypothetical protein
MGNPATFLAGGFLVAGIILGLTGCGQIDLSVLGSLRNESAGAAALEENQDRQAKR